MGHALSLIMRTGSVFLWGYVGIAAVSIGVLVVVLAVGGPRG